MQRPWNPCSYLLNFKTVLIKMFKNNFKPVFKHVFAKRSSKRTSLLYFKLLSCWICRYHSSNSRIQLLLLYRTHTACSIPGTNGQLRSNVKAMLGTGGCSPCRFFCHGPRVRHGEHRPISSGPALDGTTHERWDRCDISDCGHQGSIVDLRGE